MNEIKRVYFSSVFYKILIVAISFIDTIIINRALTVEMRGEYGVIINIITILNLIFSVNLGASYQLLYNKVKDVDKLYVNAICFQFVVYFLLSFIIYIVSNSFYVFTILIVTSVFVLRDNISSVNLVENIQKRNKLYLWSTVFYTIIILVLFLLGIKGYYWYIYSLILRYLFETLFSFISYKYSLRNWRIYLFNGNCMSTLKTMFSNSISISLIALLITCNYNLDIIMLKYYNVNNFDIGLYSVASTLVNMVWIIPDAFKDVLINRLSRTISDREVKLSIKYNIAFCLFLIALFGIVGKFFISLFYGDDYVGTFYYTMILLTGSLPMIYYKLINPYLLSINRKKVIICCLLASVIANIVSNIVVIPSFGAKGAAYSSVISYTLCGILFYYYFKKNVDFKKNI